MASRVETLSPPLIGFDGDDTLWRNEEGYDAAHHRYEAIVGRHVAVRNLAGRLLLTEQHNLHLFGYGVKSFTLSMIETALDLVGDRLTAADVREMLEIGKSLLRAPVHLLPEAAEVVQELADAGRPLVLITKGDLHNQEAKIHQSGLAPFFSAIEIVSEKDPQTYSRLITRHGCIPERFLMIGNSLRSDVLPVLQIGGYAAYVPRLPTWMHERAPLPASNPRFFQLETIRDVVGVLRLLEEARS